MDEAEDDDQWQEEATENERLSGNGWITDHELWLIQNGQEIFIVRLGTIYFR